MKDPKEVWQEAYDDAVEDGLGEKVAALAADDAVTDHSASLIDDAMEQLKANPKLEAEIEERVKHLDMERGGVLG
ncbi:hypothetical protein LCGC14_1549010 [marine sediment metagenome]|uniref:Uncharacterized protein n=1 Tax=marine sediment metagenome TaxID=412755 RepID=A0A0F9IQV8_9ZZZZ